VGAPNPAEKAKIRPPLEGLAIVGKDVPMGRVQRVPTAQQAVPAEVWAAPRAELVKDAPRAVGASVEAARMMDSEEATRLKAAVDSVEPESRTSEKAAVHAKVQAAPRVPQLLALHWEAVE
jgi:hypothetical protein